MERVLALTEDGFVQAAAPIELLAEHVDARARHLGYEDRLYNVAGCAVGGALAFLILFVGLREVFASQYTALGIAGFVGGPIGAIVGWFLGPFIMTPAPIWFVRIVRDDAGESAIEPIEFEGLALKEGITIEGKQMPWAVIPSARYIEEQKDKKALRSLLTGGLQPWLKVAIGLMVAAVIVVIIGIILMSVALFGGEEKTKPGGGQQSQPERLSAGGQL